MESNLKQLMQIKAQTDKSVDFYIYGDIIAKELKDLDGNVIQDESTFPAEIRSFLDEAHGRDVNLYINSAGGSVTAGIAIASMLQRYEGKTIAHIDGVCASIATHIALSCDEAFISDGGVFMYHKSHFPFYHRGNEKTLNEEVKKACQMLAVVDETQLATYKKRARDETAYETIKKKFNTGKDTWLTAEETVSFFDVQKSERTTAVYAKSDFIDMSVAPISESVTADSELEENYKFDF